MKPKSLLFSRENRNPKSRQKHPLKQAPISQRSSSVLHFIRPQKSDHFRGPLNWQILGPVYMKFPFKIFREFLDLKIDFDVKKGPMEEFNAYTPDQKTWAPDKKPQMTMENAPPRFVNFRTKTARPLKNSLHPIFFDHAPQGNWDRVGVRNSGFY